MRYSKLDSWVLTHQLFRLFHLSLKSCRLESYSHLGSNLADFFFFAFSTIVVWESNPVEALAGSQRVQTLDHHIASSPRARRKCSVWMALEVRSFRPRRSKISYAQLNDRQSLVKRTQFKSNLKERHTAEYLRRGNQLIYGTKSKRKH
jgi:hypothetical protein